MLALERDEVDEHVGARPESRPQRGFVAAVDLDVLDARRDLALAAAPDDNVPPTLPQPRNQRASRLAAAAEQKRAPRHGRDDSSLIF